MKLKVVPHRDVRPRTTMCLRGTSKTVGIKADHSMELRTAYAVEWLKRHGSLKATSSAIVRRAMSVYLEHLESADSSIEVIAVRRASESTSRDEEAQQAAWSRLQNADKGQPLPPFLDILLGPEARARVREVDEKADANYRQIFNDRFRKRTNKDTQP